MQKAALSELVDLHTVVRHMGQVQTLEPECSQVNQSLKIVITKLAVVVFLKIENILKRIVESIFIYILLWKLLSILKDLEKKYSPFTVSMEVVSFNC